MPWRRKKEEEIGEDQLEYDECPNCRRKVKEFVKVGGKGRLIAGIGSVLVPGGWAIGRGDSYLGDKYRCPYCRYI
jgi:ribosomal protein L37AE/L43A